MKECRKDGERQRTIQDFTDQKQYLRCENRIEIHRFINEIIPLRLRPRPSRHGLVKLSAVNGMGLASLQGYPTDPFHVHKLYSTRCTEHELAGELRNKLRTVKHLIETMAGIFSRKTITATRQNPHYFFRLPAQE